MKNRVLELRNRDRNTQSFIMNVLWMRSVKLVPLNILFFCKIAKFFQSSSRPLIRGPAIKVPMRVLLLLFASIKRSTPIKRPPSISPTVAFMDSTVFGSCR